MPPPTRPLLIALSRSEVAGTQIGILRLLEHLNRDQYPPHVFLGERGPVTDHLDRLGVSWNSTLAPLRTPQGVFDFAKAAHAHRAQILHLHAPRSLALAARAGGLAVVETVNTLRGPVSGGLVRWPWIDRTLLKLAHEVIVPSSAMKAQLESRRVPTEKIHVVPYGVNTAVFAPRPGDQGLRRSLGLRPESRVLLNVGRLSPVKGQAQLLEAMEQILEREPHAVLLIAGEGPERPCLEGMASARGVARSVKFLGSRSDLPSLLCLAEVFIQSSLEEALSIATSEAMAAGCPVVATAVGGTAELVEHKVTGLLVAPRSPPALAAGVLQLLSDSGLRSALSRAGRARAVAELQLPTMARRTEGIYDRAFARANAKRGRDQIGVVDLRSVGK